MANGSRGEAASQGADSAETAGDSVFKTTLGLIEQAQGGNRESLEKLFARYYPCLLYTSPSPRDPE